MYFSSIHVNFRVRSASSPETLWIAPGYYDSDTKDPFSRFKQTFAFLVENNDCFENIMWNGEHFQVAKAERYGGWGVGDNGGGVRCGNLSGAQIKGIGQNPLVGKANKKWHAYGGLNARDAVYEAIYGVVLNQLLPVGASRIHGVILTSSDGAYYEYDEMVPGKIERGWGALLVREACLRPGHFMRAPEYHPKKFTDLDLITDVGRVRQACKELHRYFEDSKSLIRFIGVFLRNCANQFAFAKVARLTHGGICPSNLCLDGRWIDLTNTSFLGSGQNIGGSPPFFEEPFAVFRILEELLSTVAKFSGAELNAAPLMAYYQESLSSYLTYHIAGLVGLEYESLSDEIRSGPYQVVATNVTHVLNIGGRVIIQWPTHFSKSDPVYLLQTALFISIVDPQRALIQLEALRYCRGFDAAATVSAFRSTYHAAISASSTAHTATCRLVARASVCLKRTLFSSYFYKERLDRQIADTIAADAFAARDLIDDSLSVSEMCFAQPDPDRIMLFAGAEVEVSIDLDRQQYKIGYHNEQITCATPHECARALEQLPRAKLSIQGFDFFEPIQMILETLEIIHQGGPRDE